MNRKKRALFKSVVSLILCISMLMSTTFAWFTDNVSSGNNMIAAGNLDIEMEYLNADGDWEKVNESTEVLDKNALWEPGYTEVAYLKIKNAGDLALKYALGIHVIDEIGSINIDDQPFKLSDHIKFGVVETETEVTYADRDDARNALTASKTISQGFSSEYVLEEKDDVRYATLVVFMPEETTNVANYKTGATPPEIKLGIELLATQAVHESDSFGPDYDTESEMPSFSFPENTFGENTSASVTKDSENKVAAEVTIQGTTTNAVIPAGVQLEAGTDKLTLEVSTMNQSGANITLGDNEEARSLDVHVDGVSTSNTQPMEITLKEAASKGLNIGNLRLFHVENGETVEMTKVDTFTAHNQFKYDPATGDITLYMATFSEVALVADTENAWKGNVETTWYNETLDIMTIVNADALAGLGNLVANGTNFSGKTIQLINDVNMGGENYLVEGKLQFYPIGYTSEGYKGAFSGTFDGTGHTISNIYQNTWMLLGNYDGSYYNAAMGLFGYVYGGTIKNLTVDSFKSEGEFAPTGCVAAYAANATFENIVVKNSHPQTYNTSVAAVVGRDGKNGLNNNTYNNISYNLIFRNITVDSSNTVSALWGSWDVGAAGLLGYLGSDSKVLFENCNVAATIDVYNDVCGNYQYYWYRYCGAYIGTVNKRLDNGNGALDLSNVFAKNCTVYFGDRHEYYYCEFVENSKASYTHDYQMSRVDLEDIIGQGASATCQNHNHEEHGYETVDGNSVLVEDKQAVYIPFRQLFGGYGWGIDGVDEYENIEITTINNIEKFEKNSALEGNFLYRVGNQNAFTIGKLFQEIKKDIAVDSGVYVSVTPLVDGVTMTGNFVKNESDWTQSTLHIAGGTGPAKLTIQDYNNCEPFELIVEVVDALNITSAVSSNGKDVVLLNDVKIPEKGYVNYTKCNVYGNGFIYNLEDGASTYNSKQGHGIMIVNNATLDNLVIVGDVYDSYGAYTNQSNYNAALHTTNATIRNCYIANCSAPINALGNTTIFDTTLYGGTVANLIITNGVVALENVTTVNYNDERALAGLGIVAGPDVTDTAKLILNGTLKQYNYLSEEVIPEDINARTLYNEMFGNQCSEYHIGNAPKRYINTGIVSMSEKFNINDITDNANTGYNGTSVTLNKTNGYLYS